MSAIKRPATTGHIDFNPCDLVANVSEPPVNPATKEHRRIEENEAEEFASWLYDQELNGAHGHDQNSPLRGSPARL